MGCSVVIDIFRNKQYTGTDIEKRLFLLETHSTTCRLKILFMEKESLLRHDYCFRPHKSEVVVNSFSHISIDFSDVFSAFKSSGASLTFLRTIGSFRLQQQQRNESRVERTRNSKTLVKHRRIARRLSR